MLDPEERYLYTSALLPPEGYNLESCLATTFSLDLLTLLVAPLSFVRFEKNGLAEMVLDPTALLEALRRTAENITVFCQKGRIAVPRKDSVLFSYLESAVVEVNSYYPHGVFHPKIWLLRFAGVGKSVLYRFICLSRNLTFDKSWDTVLSLEGEIVRRRFSRNRPLVDFINTLPDLAASPVPENKLNRVRLHVDELMHVDFKTPEGFDGDFAFWPMGIKGYGKFPVVPLNRSLTISPFLSDEIISVISDDTREHILVSREESIAQIDTITLDRLTGVYVLDDAATPEEPELISLDKELNIEEGNVSADIGDNNQGLSGLHAKMYITQDRSICKIWTGSANATRAAFKKRNVEFLVELSARKSFFSIEKFLAEEQGKTGFRHLLRTYRKPDVVLPTDNINKDLEKTLEGLRDFICSLSLGLQVLQDGEGFKIALTTSEESNEVIDNPIWDQDNISIQCRPITVKEIYSRDIKEIRDGKIEFANLAIGMLTSFVSFELSAKKEGRVRKLSFVLNLPLSGMPSDRPEKALQFIISDKQRFIRYLLFILAEGDLSYSTLGDAIRKTEGREQSASDSWFEEIPLLEELLKAFSRQPEKIERIAKLVQDIKAAGGHDVMPEGFDQVWEPLMSAWREVAAAE